MQRVLADDRTVSLHDHAEAAARKVPWLVVEPLGSFRYRLEDVVTLVGRASECDIVLSDPCVSDRHVSLTWESGDLILRDLQSRNGTFVNGLRIMASRVGPGVLIQAGRTRLRCVTEPERACAHILGHSAATRDATTKILRFARLEAPVLILGESGTGKELTARALHDGSERRQGPLVAVNCAGFSPELIDSELFGHERGAFTGAVERRRGAFELAHRGTLFLDELGELPTRQQAKLLRVLECPEIRRLGGEDATRIDVRVVAATNVDLRDAVRRKAFRADLYHRLAVLELHMPPLRARIEDLTELCEHFLAEFAPELGPRRLTDSALLRLREHTWPGNIRELRNVLYRAAATCSGGQIADEDLDGLQGPTSERDARTRMASFERDEILRHTLEAHRGNVAATARDLGIARSTLRSWLARTAISR